MKEDQEPYLMDDRPGWALIQKRNEEFLKELEAKYGPTPASAAIADGASQTNSPARQAKPRRKRKAKST